MNEQKNEKPQKQDASISRQFKANLNVERKLSLRSAPNPSKLLPSLRVLNIVQTEIHTQTQTGTCYTQRNIRRIQSFTSCLLPLFSPKFRGIFQALFDVCSNRMGTVNVHQSR